MGQTLPLRGDRIPTNLTPRPRPLSWRPIRRALFILLAGTVAVVLPLIVFYWSSAPPTPRPLASLADIIEVIDGNTILRGRRYYRLVGFETPETGSNARCERERTLGAAATRRLTQVVGGSGHFLTPVPCACPLGTEGTSACNYGRLCARLTVQGQDVGAILIREGLARPFVCADTSCPPRPGWC